MSHLARFAGDPTRYFIGRLVDGDKMLWQGLVVGHDTRGELSEGGHGVA